MYMCEDCGKQFEEEEVKSWTEPHGERLTGCPYCYGAYVEIQPCAICGEYPEDEYEEGKLWNGGICQACFEDGIQVNFMEYLNELDTDDQIEFYFGKCEGGYIYQPFDMLLMAQADYKDRVELHKCIFGPEREAKIWKAFIEGGDPSEFAEWLVKRIESQ